MKIPAILLTVVLTISHCRAFAVDNNSVQPRIVGPNATEKEILWQASIEVTVTNDDKSTINLLCNGAILDENWILTSASCLQGKIKEATVTTGVIDLTKKDNVQIRNASKCILHKDYNAQNVTNDIGLIKLAAPLQLKENVNKIDRFKGELKPELKVIVSSFGVDPNDKTKRGNNLKKSNVFKISDPAQCKQSVGDLSANAFCSEIPVTSNCLGGGDAGAPAVVIGDGTNPKLVGVSGILKTCDEKKPSVFTRIEPYEDWIKEQTQPGKQNSGLAFYSTPVLVLSAVVAKLFM